MSTLDLAVIGNCGFGALVDRRGRVVWSCMPRFDGDPVFCSLLNGNGDDEKFGFFDIVLEDFESSEQHYLHNTAIVVTTLYDANGSAVEITDFAPRFKQYGRIYRPLQMVRRVRPLSGSPRLTVRLRPVCDYGASRPERTNGSNHIRYITPAVTLRLTTDAPVTYILDEVPFVVEEPFTLILGPDESLTRPIDETAREFFEMTSEFWIEWVRYLSLPFEWQDAVIRAAITLKLCNFEETGAIIAAITTSIPEAAGSQRNWDYRYCWLRDAYFVVHALNRLGATKTMEDYLRYITNIVAMSEDGHLQPVYGIALEKRLTEMEVASLAGYRAMGPVRKGNQAHEHIQNDVYGSVILASTQFFFDQRLVQPGDTRLFQKLEKVGEQAVKLFDRPDAGMWELRTKAKVHTFSAVMCWAGCDRLAKVAARLGNDGRAEYWRRHADHISGVIQKEAWDEKQNSFVESFGGAGIDASLLLLNEIGFLAADDPRFAGTVAAVEKTLRHGDHIFRYATADDLGVPQTSFNICTFWYIDALAALGRAEEARDLFEKMLACRNRLGLLSEDLDPDTGELWGNFPQTYSMVGLINAAMRLSKTWEDAF
ncbi:MAG: glycoside hydrolase family 15 protein [Alphaproteobacteria bacterium]|nr:glycoside hydrolase family 15 protein [Alphaproteobacteria bacterium]